MEHAVAKEAETYHAIGMRANQYTSEERETIHKAARLAACAITVLIESRSRKQVRDMTLLLLEYASDIDGFLTNLSVSPRNVSHSPLLTPASHGQS